MFLGMLRFMVVAVSGQVLGYGWLSGGGAPGGRPARIWFSCASSYLVRWPGQSVGGLDLAAIASGCRVPGVVVWC